MGYRSPRTAAQGPQPASSRTTLAITIHLSMSMAPFLTQWHSNVAATEAYLLQSQKILLSFPLKKKLANTLGLHPTFSCTCDHWYCVCVCICICVCVCVSFNW